MSELALKHEAPKPTSSGPAAPLGRALRTLGKSTPTRNNRGVAQKMRVENPHGHLKEGICDAVLLRSTSEFDDLEAHRRFFDEIVSRRNAS